MLQKMRLSPKSNLSIYNWTTELLKNTVQHEQYVNKQFNNDRKKADLIENPLTVMNIKL